MAPRPPGAVTGGRRRVWQGRFRAPDGVPARQAFAAIVPAASANAGGLEMKIGVYRE
ncbi:MAG TPA: hypothetical protein VF746_11725 [Longimicrobium sp.]|jgi:hypothetical protein